VFISNAYAQAAPAAANAGLMGTVQMIWPFILMFAVMYFVMIRPQQKKAKEQREMMDALAKGDEVVTASGIVGRVTKVMDIYVGLEIANNTEILVQKHAITSQLPKGTLKSL
jgi:preprotein translocase subunit YajC